MGANREALNVDFRSMNIDDLASVFLNEQGAYKFPWSIGIFSDCLKAGYDCQVAILHQAQDHSRIIGHAVVSRVADEAHLMNLCVGNKYQCLGLGRQFLLHIIDSAREAAVRIMFLEVRSSNTHATSLYQSVGFQEVGKRKDYYPSGNGREDALIMSLILKFH